MLQPVTPSPTAAPSTKPTMAAPTPCSGKYVTVNILTDDYPEETSFTLVNLCTGEIEESVSKGNYTSMNTNFTEEYCLSDGMYIFTVYDSYGDGEILLIRDLDNDCALFTLFCLHSRTLTICLTLDHPRALLRTRQRAVVNHF